MLGRVPDGLANQEIAAAPVVESFTVRKHLENVYAKLGVHSRTAASPTYAAARDGLAAETANTWDLSAL